MLLEAGANPRLLCERGRTALQYAQTNNNRSDAAGMLVEYLMGTGSGERRTQERGSTDDVQADKAAAAETFSPESSGGGMRKRTETQRGKTAR